MQTEFFQKQQLVIVSEFDDMYDIRINLPISEDVVDGEKVYTYDSHEIMCKKASINIDDVIDEPTKYINWKEASQLDIIEAQVMFTALMTDTLIEGE